MASPEYTLTATLDTLTGVAAGSTANPAKLRICLCGFTSFLPRIAGTAMVAATGPTDFYSTGSAISETLWGNDQITPGSTFYSIEILDGEDNVVQCGAYILTGSGGDLSSLTPIVPAPAPAGGGLVCTACTGTVPGTVFVTATAVYGGVIAVFYRGVQQRLGIDCTVSGSTITSISGNWSQVPYALYIQAIG